MILILSGDGDLSTDIVIKTLRRDNHPYFRINAYDLLNTGFKINISGKDVELSSNGEKVKIEDVGVVWHRKFGFFKNSSHYNDSVDSLGYQNTLQISREFTALLEGVICLFKNKLWLTNPYFININKLHVLKMAAECGLKTPDSHIVSSKKDLAKLSQENQIITKSIRDPWILRMDEKIYTMYTSEIKHTELDNLTEGFFPSLVQSKVDKQYEIRTFYLLGAFYSMAIFSQSDNQTSLDFRRYNWKKPNRVTPYILPIEIEKSLENLVNMVNLNCCSIDLIKGVDGNYYFLEINPTGQFGMVDFPCNYGLHEKVAESLITLDKQGMNYEKIY